MELNLMKKRYIASLCALLLGSLSGCSAISEEECRLGDWHQIGLSDGQNGQKNNAAKYNKDCSEYQVQVDLKVYNDGRYEGLKSFCTYENGVSVGQANKSYNNVCPADLSNEFLLGYTPYYNLARAESDKHKFESDVNRYVSQLGDGDLSDRDRKNYKGNLKSSRSKLERAEAEVRKYENELELHKIQIEKGKIVKELAKNDLPDTRRAQLNKRLDSLNKQQRLYENLSQVDNTIQRMKGIANLF